MLQDSLNDPSLIDYIVAERNKEEIEREKINNVFSVFRKVDEELLEELEEVLVMSDIGMETSVKIIDELRNKIKKEKRTQKESLDLGFSSFLPT